MAQQDNAPNSQLREKRFSDEELKKFYREFKDHIEEYTKTMIRCDKRFNDVCSLLEKNNSLLSGINVLELKVEFEENKLQQERRWDETLKMINQNTDTNMEIIKRLEQIDKNTQGVVEIFNDFKSAAKLGVSFRRILLWGASIVAILGSAYAYLKHLLDKVN